MSQEFVRHPTIKNYEASRDGIVRHCRLKKPVGNVNNSGYLRFRAGGGGKSYYCHRFIYECFFGEIPKGLVIDHVDWDIKNNDIGNLQVVIQSENIKRDNTGTCKMVSKRSVKSVNATTAEEKIFQPMTSAGKYFDIKTCSVQLVADKVTKSDLSRKCNQRIIFSYSVPDTKDTIIG